MKPEIHYAASGDVNIAYAVVGEGPPDLVVVPGSFSHIEAFWQEPHFVDFFERLGSFARLVFFDKRGTGMSDRVTVGTLEDRMDDIRAVMDDIGLERAAVMGISEGGALSMLFAATYPERTTALILYGAYAKDDEDPSEEQFREYGERMRRVWGTEEHAKIWAKRMSPSLANDQQFILWLTQASRMWGSPGAAVALARMNAEIDVRHILPTVRVPTLVLHRQNDMAVPASEGRYLAASIPNSKYVELPGVDHLPFAGDGDSVIDEIEEFLTGVRDPLERNRVLATVMFTDIVESTERALDLGDRKWREVLENHHGVVRKNLARFRGTEVDTAGDGFFATFDGPARAIRCARAISENVRPLGIEVRAGLHTGECEIIGEKVGGIAVHIGARVLSKAEANQVMVSSTVKDLVAGSGIQFEDRGMHMLKGIPGEWHLYRVSN